MEYTAEQEEVIILKSVIKEFIGNGFLVRIHDGEDFAGPASMNVKSAMKETRSTDMDTIYAIVNEDNLSKVSEEVRDIYNKNKEKHPKVKDLELGFVTMIYGNGIDVLSDNSLSVEKYIEKTKKVINDLEAGVYKPEKPDVSTLEK